MLYKKTLSVPFAVSAHSFFAFTVIFFLLSMMLTGGLLAGTSVYVIEDQSKAEIYHYDVNGVELTLPPEVITGNSGYGVGLACDPERGLIFMTSEGSGAIQISDMTSMQYKSSINVPNSGNLAGIVADVDKKRLYVVQRYTNHLYVLTWINGDNYALVYPAPHYIELEGCDGAFGIALDEENDLLYVADNTQVVKCYRTDNWLQNSQAEPIVVGHSAISIAVDMANQYIYTGSMAGYGASGGSTLGLVEA